MRMSFGQERIWFLYRLEGPSSTYNITPVFRLRGPLSLPALAEAFNALVERHETLRMRFVEIDGIGMQIVDPSSAAVAVAIDRRSLLDRPQPRRRAEAERIILEETARPFDLERGGLLRVTVIAIGADDHILLPFMHHIIGDGWSLGVLQRELSVAYEHIVSRVNGASSANDARGANGASGTTDRAVHDPLLVQYPDFAAWQRGIQQSDRGRQGLSWWRRELAGAPQTLVLPLDFERPPAVTFNGRVLRRTIPESTVQAVAACGRAHGCSLFMTLLAAYGVLLHRHSGQDDILIGSPVAGRPLTELEGLIGCFVNTVVLRIRMDGDPSFVELLRRVRQTALDAYSWQDVPVEAVIDAVLTERDPSRIPLYQTQFSLQNVPVKSVAMSSLRVEQMPMDRVAAKNDLLFILETRGGDGIDAELEYNTDLFREDTVRALGEELRPAARGARVCTRGANLGVAVGRAIVASGSGAGGERGLRGSCVRLRGIRCRSQRCGRRARRAWRSHLRAIERARRPCRGSAAGARLVGRVAGRTPHGPLGGSDHGDARDAQSRRRLSAAVGRPPGGSPAFHADARRRDGADRRYGERICRAIPRGWHVSLGPRY